MFKRGAVITALLLAGLMAVVLTACEKTPPGVSKTEIKIGHINPYSGPASAYGTIGRSIAGYFKLVNDKGGINGRKINFISYDDGYSPPKTVEMARKLVESDNVLLIFQSLGTPTNSSIHAYMNEKKVPHLFVATGASKWNDPKGHPWTMGWQPNYQAEANIYAEYIKENLPKAKIGILYQNDDYGKDYLEGFKKGMAGASGPAIVMEQSYEVTSPTIDSQIVNLKNSGADVFLNVTTPKFAAQAIKKAGDIGWKPVHFLNNVSTSVSLVLVPAGLEHSEGLMTTGYAMDPTDKEWMETPAMKDWTEFMKKYYPDGSLENGQNVYGYSVAMTMEHVLKAAGDDLTRENIMKQAASLKGLVIPTLLPGVTLNTSPTDFAPIEQMQLQKFDSKLKSWVRFGKIYGPAN